MTRCILTLAVGFVACVLSPELLSQELPQSTQVQRLIVNRSQFPDRDVRTSLKQQAIESNQDIVIDEIAIADKAACSDCPIYRPEDNAQIRGASKMADVVVIGTVLSNLSALTTNDAWVMTDSEVHVDEILKGSINNGVLDGGGSLSEITVTYPGGAVKTKGHAIVVRDGEINWLTIGHTYVFFLQYIPASHSYKQLLGAPGYDISSTQIQSISRINAPENKSLVSNKTAWIAALRSSIEKEKESERR